MKTFHTIWLTDRQMDGNTYITSLVEVMMGLEVTVYHTSTSFAGSKLCHYSETPLLLHHRANTGHNADLIIWKLLQWCYHG